MQDINFFESYASSQKKKGGSGGALLIFLVCALAACTVYAGLIGFKYFADKALADKNESLIKARGRISELTAQNGYISALRSYSSELDKVNALLAAKSGVKSSVIDRMRAAVPAGAILTDISFTKAGISISGNAQTNAAALSVAGNLTSSGLIKDIDAMDLTLDTASGLYKFSFACTLKTGGDAK